jgi:hypothetical protein
MRYRNYVEKHFQDLILTSPLFYSWNVGIRFELGEPEMIRIDEKLYMEQVYLRAIELFKALHGNWTVKSSRQQIFT